MKRVNRKLLLAAMLTLILAAALSSANATGMDEVCEQCEAGCYATAENVPDYNACVTMCNYTQGCNIPIIHENFKRRGTPSAAAKKTPIIRHY